MQAFLDFLKHLHDSGYLERLAETGGVPVLALIVFAETGLLVGFFLPGDTMLFGAGVVASTLAPSGEPYLDIRLLLISLTLAAIAGDQLGYFLGLKTGQAIYQRKDGRFFKKKYVVAAHEFYTRYGAFAVIGARFVPIMRTFVPFMAGVGEMPYARFLLIDTIGGILWIGVVVGAGYLLGPQVQGQMHIVVPAIAVVSMLPVLIGVARAFFARRATA